MLCLDTNVVVDVLRGRRPHLRTRLSEEAHRGTAILVSSIVVQELAFGALISARADLQLERLGEFLSAYEVQAFDGDDAFSAARVRADLKARGSEIGIMDAMIAGQALAKGWAVVTANLRDFLRVDGLDVIDWSDAEAPRTYIRSAVRPR